MFIKRLFSTSRFFCNMELKEVVKQLNKFAPTSLAEKWDNVGILIEPSSPLEVKKIMLTNDLTPPVVDEAVKLATNLVISYHPPIFSGMKCVTQKTWKERIVTTCLENRIAVFSPHTSYDCVKDGVNDWLIQAFDVQDVRPLQQATELQDGISNSISFNLASKEDLEKFEKEITGLSGVQIWPSIWSETNSKVCVGCSQQIIGDLLPLIQRYTDQFIEVKQMSKVPKPGFGMGRKGKLKTGITVNEAVQKVKSHLQLPSVRLAKSPDSDIVNTVAVCAGSGGSLLRDVKASLYLTGEMLHHDVLHAVYNGSNVILCDHSNTERGFLTVLQNKLQSELPGIDICVSTVDKDPLEIV